MISSYVSSQYQLVLVILRIGFYCSSQTYYLIGVIQQPRPHWHHHHHTHSVVYPQICLRTWHFCSCVLTVYWLPTYNWWACVCPFVDLIIPWVRLRWRGHLQQLHYARLLVVRSVADSVCVVMRMRQFAVLEQSKCMSSSIYIYGRFANPCICICPLQTDTVLHFCVVDPSYTVVTSIASEFVLTGYGQSRYVGARLNPK